MQGRSAEPIPWTASKLERLSTGARPAAGGASQMPRQYAHTPHAQRAWAGQLSFLQSHPPSKWQAARRLLGRSCNPCSGWGSTTPAGAFSATPCAFIYSRDAGGQQRANMPTNPSRWWWWAGRRGAAGLDTNINPRWRKPNSDTRPGHTSGTAGKAVQFGAACHRLLRATKRRLNYGGLAPADHRLPCSVRRGVRASRQTPPAPAAPSHICCNTTSRTLSAPRQRQYESHAARARGARRPAGAAGSVRGGAARGVGRH